MLILFIYLDYNTMVAGFISNYTYNMWGKQQKINQSENKWSNSISDLVCKSNFLRHS